jgi:hypothetical protein
LTEESDEERERRWELEAKIDNFYDSLSMLHCCSPLNRPNF